jgi:hypothetical protein
MSDESSRAVGTNPSRQIGTFTFSPPLSNFSCRVCGAPLRRALRGAGSLFAGRRTIVSVNYFWTAPGTEVVSGARTSQGLSRAGFTHQEKTYLLLALNLMGD